MPRSQLIPDMSLQPGQTSYPLIADAELGGVPLTAAAEGELVPAWFEIHHGHRDFVVALAVDVVGRQAVCTALVVRPRDGARLTTDSLREIPLGRLLARMPTELFIDPQTHQLGAPGPMRTLGPTTRRRRLADGHFRDVADLYDEALRLGLKPIPHIQSIMATRLDRPYVEPPTAAGWVVKARKLGLLPPTTKGRARGRTRGDEE